MEKLDLNALMLFREIVSAGSLNQAALKTGVPKSTVSRRLRELEAQLGAVLMKRGARKLTLTEVGSAVYERCERIALEAQETRQMAARSQGQLDGVVRISVPLGFGTDWGVNKALVAFSARYPSIELVVHTTNRWVDVEEESFDIAVRVGRIQNEGIPVRRLARFARGVYAHPELVAAVGPPQQPIELADRDCIGLQVQVADGLWTFDGPGGPRSPPFRARVSSPALARDMALAGSGFVILPHSMCREHVAAGRLVRVLENWDIPPIDVSATYLEQRHLPRRIRTLIDFLREQVAAESDAA